MIKALNIIAIIVVFALTATAQSARLTSKMIYHGGHVLPGTQNIYPIYYGCWTNNCGTEGDTKTMQMMTDFLISRTSKVKQYRLAITSDNV